MASLLLSFVSRCVSEELVVVPRAAADLRRRCRSSSGVCRLGDGAAPPSWSSSSEVYIFFFGHVFFSFFLFLLVASSNAAAACQAALELRVEDLLDSQARSINTQLKDRCHLSR